MTQYLLIVLPLMRLLWIAEAGALCILIAALCLQNAGETVMERNRRFLVFLAWVGVGGFALRLLLLFVGKYVAASLLDNIAAVCFWVSIAAMVGVGVVFNAASDEARANALRDFFRPINIVINKFGNINVQGLAAIGNQGSHIVQSATSGEIQQQIYSLINQLKALPASQLLEDRKQEAIGHLHTLDDQCTLQPPQRNPSKIDTALQRIPAICSGIATCFQAWEKIESVLKPHLGFKI